MRPFFEHVVNAVRSSAEHRGKSVRQARRETQAAIAHHRVMRQVIARTMRRALHKNRAAVIGSLRAALAPVINGARRDDGRPGGAPAPRQGAWTFFSEPAHDAAADAAYARLQRQVLDAVEQHPNGVRAQEIGNVIGVDWRQVVPVALTLVETGLVDQVNDEFYPAGKVSRAW